MGRTGRKGECGALGSLEGEQVMYETSDDSSSQVSALGPRGAAAGLQ